MEYLNLPKFIFELQPKLELEFQLFYFCEVLLTFLLLPIAHF